MHTRKYTLVDFLSLSSSLYSLLSSSPHTFTLCSLFPLLLLIFCHLLHFNLSLCSYLLFFSITSSYLACYHSSFFSILPTHLFSPVVSSSLSSHFSLISYLILSLFSPPLSFILFFFLLRRRFSYSIFSPPLFSSFFYSILFFLLLYSLFLHLSPFFFSFLHSPHTSSRLSLSPLFICHSFFSGVFSSLLIYFLFSLIPSVFFSTFFCPRLFSPFFSPLLFSPFFPPLLFSRIVSSILSSPLYFSPISLIPFSSRLSFPLFSPLFSSLLSYTLLSSLQLFSFLSSTIFSSLFSSVLFSFPPCLLFSSTFLPFIVFLSTVPITLLKLHSFDYGRSCGCVYLTKASKDIQT